MAAKDRGARLVAGVVGGGVDRVRRRAAVRLEEIPDPAIGDDRDGVPPGQWKPRGLADRLGLPPGCPVHPLGVDGQTIYFIDDIGQLFVIPEGRQFGQDPIQRLFGTRPLYLYWAWPRWREAKFDRQGNEVEPPKVTGWRAEVVREDLFAAAKSKGVWNQVERVRGRGAWIDAEKRLVLHCGDVLYVAGELTETGEHGAFFYPRRPALPRPFPRAVSDDINPGPAILSLLRTWSWERVDVDPILMLGWMVVAAIGGALDWRPSLFLVGDAGTGKSHLQRLVQTIFGAALVHTTDTTPAGIYQRIGTDALPIGVDELEAEIDNRRAAGVIKLARLAASGGLMLRGGQDNSGVEFQARSPFLFSAIIPPPLPPQDLSRLAMLQLRDLDQAKLDAGPSLDMAMELILPRILRRVMDRWSEWPGLLGAYKAALFSGGHDTRGQDTYGTLLAACHLLLGDEMMADAGVSDVAAWGELLGVAALPDHVRRQKTWRRCLTHILQARVPAWRHGRRQTVGQLLEDLREGKEEMTEGLAQRELVQAGLGLLHDDEIAPGSYLLAVPNASPLVAELMAGTVWGGEGGQGAWASALRMAPPAIVCTDKRKNNRSVGGVKGRCTLVILEAFWALGDD